MREWRLDEKMRLRMDERRNFKAELRRIPRGWVIGRRWKKVERQESEDRKKVERQGCERNGKKGT